MNLQARYFVCTLPFTLVGGIGPVVEYAPAVQAPLDGLAAPVMSEHRAVSVPEHKEVRFAPTPITADPDCGTPLAFNPALDT